MTRHGFVSLSSSARWKQSECSPGSIAVSEGALNPWVPQCLAHSTPPKGITGVPLCPRPKRSWKRSSQTACTSRPFGFKFWVCVFGLPRIRVFTTGVMHPLRKMDQSIGCSCKHRLRGSYLESCFGPSDYRLHLLRDWLSKNLSIFAEKLKLPHSEPRDQRQYLSRIIIFLVKEILQQGGSHQHQRGSAPSHGCKAGCISQSPVAVWVLLY